MSRTQILALRPFFHRLQPSQDGMKFHQMSAPLEATGISWSIVVEGDRPQ
ncbi:hypothetical protein [Streptomyces sp. NPDC006551]